MALLQESNNVLLGLFWLLCMTLEVSSHSSHMQYTPPNVTRLTDLFSSVSIGQGFSTFFGGSSVKLLNNGSYVYLALDKSTDSGLASKNKYYYGFFSAAIRLPAGLYSGVVVAFHLSNADTYPHNHDEIDIELLGHDKRNDWVLQTNVFLVDNVPVREFVHNSAFPSVYRSKAMSVFATIWDGSEGATHGGKYPAEAPSSLDPVEGQEFVRLSKDQSVAMDWARRKLIFYSYCNDRPRLKVLPPECK
ncbi:hypothetical protein P3X46_017754 [Hevea brasiliensis]|uniref:Xyloglucan endotransglucosylase/hydrolase n=1 Tax=Hevea brasiliensis TaxID=3981 RepID=A0ABQ9LSM1_HEVBR|nr:hypothetical protein P3X46_017754 [Hevea brasiliensis]